MTGQEVLEIKRTLDGREHRFACTLVRWSPGWVVLRYVLSAPAAVGTLAIPPGTETLAHYWPDRPYTAYHWLNHAGQTLGVYLNAAADVRFGPATVAWLDLALDVLVTAQSGVEVLDDDEARAAPAWAQPAIAAARKHLLVRAPAIAAEVTRLSQTAREGGVAGPRK